MKIAVKFTLFAMGRLVTSNLWRHSMLLVLVLAVLQGVDGEDSQKTNLLFIMSDQHNARALGCYGNPIVKTPTAPIAIVKIRPRGESGWTS